MKNDQYKQDYEHVNFTDVKVGEMISIDNFADGEYPKADLLISGPYRVTHG